MEKQKGATTSSGYNVSDKKPSSPNNITEQLLLFTPKMATQDDLDRPFSGGGGAANDVVTGSMYSSYVHGENSTPNLQAFDIFGSYPNTPYYKSPGGISFTGAQWKELERQAMIYKYMISAVPVPNDLLFPISRPFSTDPSLYNVRYNKNGDPEPGRCKRTDGKKWRCSRDVAPHQKYCERHLHRGRPRSRKPVEITKNNNNNNNNNGVGGENKKKTRVEIPKSTTSQQFVPAASEPLLLFNAKSDLSISTNRDLSLMMEAENRWHHLIEPSMGFSTHGPSIYASSSPIFHQDYIQNHPLNVFPYSSYPPPSEIEAPIPFIDAWSIDNTNNAPHKSLGSPTHEHLSTSLDLSMAMAAGNALDEEMENIQMGSWVPFARGGPLAEALQPGSGAVGCTNLGPPSPHESISNTATTVSSPSGVIQRGLFSNSDGSVCNSPTVPSEVVFQWLN